MMFCRKILHSVKYGKGCESIIIDNLMNKMAKDKNSYSEI